MLVPAVQKVRESANRTECINRLKNIALALNAYADREKHFPPEATNIGNNVFNRPKPYDTMEFHSWMSRILPFLELQDLSFKIKYNAWPWWQHPYNERVLSIYRCSSDHRPQYIAKYGDDLVALTGYLGINGTDQLAYDGILYVNAKVTFKMILDGVSNTMVVGERPPSDDLAYGWWMAGSGDSPYFGATDVVLGVNELKNPGGSNRDVFRNGSTNDPTNQHRWHFWSLHNMGSNFAFADGAVRFLSYDIGETTLKALATRAGGETPPLPPAW